MKKKEHHKKTLSRPPKPIEKQLYNALIFSVLIALLLISVSVYLFRSDVYSKRIAFSEVYFANPDILPNRISLNHNYDYDFTFKSNDKIQKNFTYFTGIELYNLYDLTESRYECLSRFRQKIYLEWAEPADNFSVLQTEQNFKEIENLVVLPDYDRIINWTSYNFEFDYKNAVGKGQIAVFFAHGNLVKYSLVIDEANSQVMFNDKVTSNELLLKENLNHVKIRVLENSILVLLNDEIVVNEVFNHDPIGQFGFESKDAYYPIFNAIAFRESPVDVPDNNNVYEYNTFSNFLAAKIRDIRDLRSKSVKLQRTFKVYNETINCEKEEFYCEYFNLPNDISFSMDEPNLTKVVEKIPVVKDGLNYILSPTDLNSSRITWTNYSVIFSHDKPHAQGSIIFKFEEKWAIMITQNNSYFLRTQEPGITVIDEIRNPKIDSAVVDVLIEINDNLITLYMNQLPVFVRETPFDFTGGHPEIYVKSEVFEISPISLLNHDEICQDENRFTFCELHLQPPTVRRDRTFSEQEEDYRIDYTNYNKNAINLDVFEFIGNQLSPKNKNVTPQQKEPVKFSLNIPVYNPFIPDRKIVFNTPSTEITNFSNFSLEYGYQSLDGAGVMELGLQDLEGNDIIHTSILEKQNKILIFFNDGEKDRIETINRYINTSTPHNLKLEVINGRMSFYLDKEEIYSINSANIRSGHYFIGSRNTYLDLGKIRLDIYDKDFTKSISINENPCEFKLIYLESTQGGFILSPEETLTLNSKFNVNQDFDYGRVFVELYDSAENTEPLSVHFWVIRDDE